MASFEEAAATDVKTDECTKYPLRRVAPSIHKFIKILQIDLDRLARHRLNITRVCNFSSDIITIMSQFHDSIPDLVKKAVYQHEEN